MPEFPKPDFRDVSVSAASLLTANDRFGKGAAEVIKDYELPYASASAFGQWATDEDEESDSESEGYGLPTGLAGDSQSQRRPRASDKPFVPRLQHWRMNLTALSQVYNLYFAAYGNKIWVYRLPGPLAVGLKGDPALILCPSNRSKVAPLIGGHIDRVHHDHANHLITGFLGDLELLLIAYDDGDVIAYYTREIARYVAQKATCLESSSLPHPSPFFHESVGASAWGLAIHAKSRLIAVSSNKHEVTVFAFALNRLTSSFSSLRHPVMADEEAAVLQRKRNWRILLFLGPSGNNIPSIDFVSNYAGHAEYVCAVDISEQFWLLDIWRPLAPPTLLRPRDTHWTRHECFWGVLALPDTSFLDLGMEHPHPSKGYAARLRNWQVALGLSELCSPSGEPPLYWIDVSDSMDRVFNSPLFDPEDDYSPAAYPIKARPEFLGGPLPDIEFYDFSLPQSEGESSEGDEDSYEYANDNDYEVDQGDYEYAEGDEDEEEEQDDDYDDDDDGEGGGNGGEGQEVEMVNSEEANQVTEDQEHQQHHHHNWDFEKYFASIIVSGSNYGLGLQTPEQTGGPNASEVLDFLSTEMDPPDFPKSSGALLRPIPIAHLPKDAQISRDLGEPVPRMNMIYKPHIGKTFKDPHFFPEKVRWLRRRKEVNLHRSTKRSSAAVAAIAEYTSFFVTAKSDARLMSTEADFIDLYCADPARVPSLPGAYSHIYRVNMVLHVPELNLVVAANQAGRVALISLIKSPFAYPRAAGDRSFRVDMLLPTRYEEAKRKLRPKVPLFGVAIGPVPEVYDKSLRLRPVHERPKTPDQREYRLILHYRDHTILTYVISRPSPYSLRVV